MHEYDALWYLGSTLFGGFLALFVLDRVWFPRDSGCGFPKIPPPPPYPPCPRPRGQTPKPRH